MTVEAFDYVVVGAGPAGLQLGYYLEQNKRSYVILEAGETPGTFFRRFPRHRTLISINKVYTGIDDEKVNLRWDWNSLLNENEELLFKQYSKRYFPNADDYVRYLCDFAERYKLNVRCGVEVASVTRDGIFYLNDTQGNTYCAKRLIIATGFRKPNVPNVPGIEHAENYVDMPVDPQDFVNQRVLIVGKGNSGFETADNLVETAALIHIISPRSLKLAWKTHYVGHLRAINNNFLDTYQLKSQNAMLDANIDKIERKDGKLHVTMSYMHANDEQETLVYDRVLVCAGFRFDSAIFDETCRPELVINDRFPNQTSEWESTNVKDLYFAGTLTQMRDFKKKQSGFIHGFRYNVQFLGQLLEYKYHQRPLPSRTISATAESLAQAILDRMNTSSGLWQQSGFMTDVIVVKGDTASYYDEVPNDYVHESELGAHDHYYTIMMDFGQERIDASPDIFAIDRVHKNDVERAALSTALHPIVRRFSRGELLSVHHVIEDLAGEWKEEVHTKPLLEYFGQELLSPAELPRA